MSKSYEIELVRFEHGVVDYHLALLSTLTGLEWFEIKRLLPDDLKTKQRWRGQDFVRAALSLKFNVNQRFKKFDPDSPWPCLLRCKLDDKGWWALAYNAGTVYAPAELWGEASLKGFLAAYPDNPPTSMLQIWMSDTHVIRDA